MPRIDAIAVGNAEPSPRGWGRWRAGLFRADCGLAGPFQLWHCSASGVLNLAVLTSACFNISSTRCLLERLVGEVIKPHAIVRWTVVLPM